MSRARQVLRLFPAAAVMTAIWVLSSRPAVPMAVSDLDKLAHGTAFGVVGALLRWGVGAPKRTRAASVWCAIVAIVYGAVDEVHQMFVPTRTPSVGDWIADAAGAIIGVWLVDRVMRART